MLKSSSYHQTESELNRKWFHIDATGMVVGRLATTIATMLKGKHKPTFTPSIDNGDFVVVTNCEKIVFTGKKMKEKNYFWHSNNIGGIKKRNVEEQLAIHPELVIYEAVKGMLGKTTLGRKQLTKLKIFKGDKHDHEAQQPETLNLKK